MTEVMACPQNVSGGGNQGGTTKSKKKGSINSGSGHKRQSASEGGTTSKRGSGSKLNRSASGISKDGTSSAEAKSSKPSATSGKQRKPAKRLSSASGLTATTETTAHSAGSKSGGGGASKTVKPRRKPANRAKSFDGTASVGMSVATSNTATTNGSTKKGSKKPSNSSKGTTEPPKLQKQNSETLLRQVSSEHSPNKGTPKAKRQPAQAARPGESMPDLSFQEKRKSSRPEGDMLVPPSPRVEKRRSKSKDASKVRRRPSDKNLKEKRERGRDHTSKDSSGPNTDPTKSYFPNKSANSKELGLSSDGAPTSPKRSRSVSKTRSASKTRSRSSSKTRSRSSSKHGRRSSSKSSSNRRSSSKNPKAAPAAAASSDKPKLPCRTVSDSSLNKSKTPQNPSSLLGGQDDDENDFADPDASDRSLAKISKRNSKSRAASALTSSATSTTSAESRGLSILEANGNPNFRSSVEDSRGMSLLMEESKLHKSNNKSGNSSSNNRSSGRDMALSPPTRERSISNRGKSRTTGNGLLMEEENNKSNNNNKSHNKSKGSQSLLGVDNEEGEEEEEKESWQVDAKAMETLGAKGGKDKRRMRDLPTPKKSSNHSLQKNASLPARKGSIPDLGFDYDESQASDVDSSKKKALCGLLPQSKQAITTESSVTGCSLPGLMDSSFSSLHSKDESVSTYLSHKKAGLIVAAEVHEGPMKDFLGNLTSTIEKKHASFPASSAHSVSMESIDPSQLQEDKEAAKEAQKAAKKKPTLSESLNSSFMNSGVNSLSGSALRIEEDTASLPSLMSFGPKGSTSVAPELETQQEEPEDGRPDDDEMSLPSLMAFEKKDGTESVTPPRIPPRAPSMDDDEMSLPSLMAFGPKDGGTMDDASHACSMPSLSSFRTKDSCMETNMADDSMPSLASMQDDGSVAPALRQPKIPESYPGKPGYPLHNIPDEDEESEEEEESVEPEEVEEEPYDEGDYGEPYEESMTEMDESNLDESNAQDDEYEEEEEEELDEEESEEQEQEQEQEESESEFDDEEEFAGEEEDSREEAEEECEYEEDGDEIEQDSPQFAAKITARASKGSKSQKGRKAAKQAPPQQPQQQAVQFVVKPKKKKKSKGEKKKKNAKEEQVQMWQDQFQQEQLLQQQQVLFQQQQQLLHQHQMMQQQQYWMQNGMPMMHYGGMGVPNPMMDANGQMLNTSNHTHSTGMIDSSGASGMMTNSSRDPMASSTHSEYSGSVRQKGDSSSKRSSLRHSQSLDYDFSFLDNPDMPEVSEASADDILQPMKPAYTENENSNTMASKAKKKEKDKKVPALSFTSRFKKSVKKIKSATGFAGSGKKILDTGLKDKQFFPDDYNDSDEESTMKGLLSG